MSRSVWPSFDSPEELVELLTQEGVLSVGRKGIVMDQAETVEDARRLVMERRFCEPDELLAVVAKAVGYHVYEDLFEQMRTGRIVHNKLKVPELKSEERFRDYILPLANGQIVLHDPWDEEVRAVVEKHFDPDEPSDIALADRRSIRRASHWGRLAHVTWADAGQRVRGLREQAGQTPDELGADTELREEDIREIEGGERNIHVDEVIEYSRHFAVPARYVARGDEEDFSLRPFLDRSTAQQRSPFYLRPLAGGGYILSTGPDHETIPFVDSTPVEAIRDFFGEELRGRVHTNYMPPHIDRDWGASGRFFELDDGRTGGLITINP